MLSRDGSLHLTFADLLQGGKFLGAERGEYVGWHAPIWARFQVMTRPQTEATSVDPAKPDTALTPLGFAFHALGDYPHRLHG